MSLTGQTGGLWMLLVLGGLTIRTSLPVWVLLIGVSSGFSIFGLLATSIDIHTLSALPLRMIGLLENDLLQALPLYVFIGMLLQRLPAVDALFVLLNKCLNHLPGHHSGSALAALSVGALIAPMNGSVASSSFLLSRLVAPRMEHLTAARSTALISAAATIGVVIPPSLVLILLGDAMMRAHTEASHLPGFMNAALSSPNIINTQGVFNAALLPGLTVLVLWALVVWWQSKSSPSTLNTVRKTVALSPMQSMIALLPVGVILILLIGVFTGKLFAVEAAATGGVLLILATLLTRALNWRQWRHVLSDTLQLSGALMALLVGATVFSLIFRLFGTDRWLTSTLLSSPLSPLVTAAGVLLLVALCAWVLDAFEMIFVIIPIIAPPLIAMLGDAQQSAVLLLLVLQLSFLIPPMGYAVLIARSQSNASWLPIRQLLPALLPFVAMQLAVLVLVFLLPQTVHLLDPPITQPALTSDADIVRQMQEMAAPRISDQK